jgi:STE24 endopeptidase
MTKKLFFLDALKSFLLTLSIGGTIVALVAWFYTLSPDRFWIYAWVFMTLFSLFMMMFYSTLIVPIFNKQTKLGDGELRDAIQKFASSVGFHIDDIFVIDGSKRSSKANAYFS